MAAPLDYLTLCKVLSLSVISMIAEVFPATQIRRKHKAHPGVFVFTYLPIQPVVSQLF